jgi:hypothetical protein
VWTLDRTRKEAFATILAACWHKRQSGLLKIGIYLSGQITTFRYDLSSTDVIITQEDRRMPAIQIGNDQSYYHRYDVELQFSREQCRTVPLAEARDVILDENPTAAQARRVFAALGLALPDSFGDHEIDDIIGKAVRPAVVTL